VYYIQEVLIKEQGQEWDIESESIIGPDGHSNYPEFFSDEKIRIKKSGMNEIFWSCQYLNNPLPEGMMTFNLKKLLFIRPSQFKEIFPYGQLICGFDPSLGKKHSDYPAVWWAHYYNDTITFFDAIDKKIELSLLVHQIAYRNKLYRCREMVYEDNGVTLVDKAIKDAHDRIGWRINIDPVHHGSDSNKNERIVSTQPELYSGAVQFLSDYETRYPEAMNQLIFYGAYTHDDFPDCMEMIISYFKRPHFRFVRYDQKH
jgi:predicted phage terminase large subunit-like protein